MRALLVMLGLLLATAAQAAPGSFTLPEKKATPLGPGALITLQVTDKVKFYKTPVSILRAQLDAYDGALEKKLATPFVKEISESQRAFAERAVKWEQDVVVDRRMAYDHYFGKKPAQKKA